MILSKISTQAEKILNIAENSLKEGILTKEIFEEIKESFKKNKIKVGICGQVKTGKSTFINSYFFGKNILPVASTPMTAALSRITYGEKPSVEVEFFTKEEWNRIEELASKSETEESSEEIKAAKEYIKFSKTIKEEISKLLDGKIEISFDEIGNYVGSNGRYTPIVKSLSIFIPEEILKYVEIVDTPGTNDPVASREQRTFEFLKEADVVFLFCYAGRPFDQSDRDLLRRLKNSIGKVIIVINKKDIILAEEGSEEKVIQRFKEQIRELIKEIKREKGNPLVVEMLEKANDKIITFSSLWVLLGKMEESEIRQNEDLYYYFEKFQEEYPSLKTQSDFLKNSGIEEIDSAIKEVIKEKDEILLRKPINMINSSYEEKIKQHKKEKDQYEREKRNYEFTLKEIEKELNILKETEKKINNEILPKRTYELNETRRGFLKETDIEIKNLLSNECKILSNKIPEKEWWKTHKGYCEKCEDIFDENFRNTKIKVSDFLKKQTDQMSKKLEDSLEVIFKEIFHLGSDLSITQRDFYTLLNEIKTELLADLSGIVSFSRNYQLETEGWWFTKSDAARTAIINQISKIILEDYSEHIKNYLNSYDYIFQRQIQKINSIIQDRVINPIKEPLERSEVNYKDNQARIKEIDMLIEEINEKIQNMENKYKKLKDELNLVTKV